MALPPRFAAQVAQELKMAFLRTGTGSVSDSLSGNYLDYHGLGGLRAAQQLMTPVLKPLWAFQASVHWR